jgi:hemerythrin-like metal-binding protein
MDKVEWREKFSTGIEFLDYINRNLLDLINNLIEIRNSNQKDTQLLSSLLSQIQDFALTHFDHEEKFLTKLHREDFSEHKMQHILFKKKLAFFCFEMSNNPQETSLDEFCDFLAMWFIHHSTSFKDNITQAYRKEAL